MALLFKYFAGQGPKKKLTKKERARLEAERAEQIRIQQEIERQNYLRAEKERLEKERIEAEQKELREIADQQIRVKQLRTSCEKIQQLLKDSLLFEIEERKKSEWNQYLKCDGLPDPAVCKQMHTYLHLWKMKQQNITINDVAEHTKIVLWMLAVLESLIKNPLDATEKHVEDWRYIFNSFREAQSEDLDIATYTLIRDIEKNLTALDIKTCTYSKQTEYFTLCLWALLKMPVPLYNPRATAPPRVSIDFKEVKVSILFPHSVTCESMAVRLLWLQYDHISEKCAMYNPPSTPEELKDDLNEYTLKEWTKRQQLKLEKKIAKDKENKEREESQLKDPDKFFYKPDYEETLVEGIEPEKPIEKSVNDIIVENEEKILTDVRNRLKPNIHSNKVNLRKYSVVGGIIHIDLLHQPPQPMELNFELSVTALQLPKSLQSVPWYVKYVPPPAPGPGVRRLPEEIEAELKQQETEFEKLALINIDLPETVLWFEPPLICQWDEEKKVWSTEDVHDIKYNEDKFSISFRTGRFGIFGVAANRYSNLPYQTWELKPDSKGTGVILSITAAVVIVEFVVRDHEVCLTQLQNGATMALQDKVGNWYKLPELIKILRTGAVDIFPSFDVFCYTEGTCEKLWPLEKHLYYCMAFLSTAYNFTWSRWNLLSGKRNIVVQMREYVDRKKLPIFSTLLVTPLKAALIDCTEVSQSFNTNSLDNSKYYSDLLHLMEGTSTVSSRRKIRSASFQMIHTVSELLIATRVLSFA